MKKRSRKEALEGQRANKRATQTPEGSGERKKVEWSDINMNNELLESYYQRIMTKEDFEDTFKYLRISLPACVRLCRSAFLWRVTLAEIKRVSSQFGSHNYILSDELIPPEGQSRKLEALTEKRLSSNAQDECPSRGASSVLPGQNENSQGAIIPWFPKSLSWQWSSLNRVCIRKDARYKKLKSLMIMEDQRGAIVRQEAASMIPPLYLDLNSDHLILDMCAAPGSKTSQILEFMLCSDPIYFRKMQGGVIANEINVKRAMMLSHQLARLGIPGFAVTAMDAAKIPLTGASGVRLPGFDRILADVPCTGDGTIRKQPDIWRSWSPNGGLALHTSQLAILIRGLALLKVGGRLVYSTCSMNPIENEAVIGAALLRTKGSIHLISPEHPSGLKTRKGLLSWTVSDATLSHTYRTFEEVPEKAKTAILPSMFPAIDVELDHCIRIYPQDNNTGAFFLAVLAKTAELPENLTTGKKKSKSSSAVVKRPENLADHHSHKFQNAEHDTPELIDLKNYFGLSSDFIKVDDEAITTDKLDLRRLLYRSTNSPLKIKPPCLVSDNSEKQATELALEPEANADEIRKALGPACDRFPLETLLHRDNSARRLMSCTEKMEHTDFVCMGVRTFERLESREQDRYPGCQWRIVQTGIPSILPFMSKRIIYVNAKIGRRLLLQEKISAEDIRNFERTAQILNLSSCRTQKGTDFNIQSGSLVAIVVPPNTIPLDGFFPEPNSQLEEDCMSMASPNYLKGTLKDFFPIACLMSQSEVLIPYISKLDSKALLYYVGDPGEPFQENSQQSPS